MGILIRLVVREQFLVEPSSSSSLHELMANSKIGSLVLMVSEMGFISLHV
jgi:hypothetical protein